MNKAVFLDRDGVINDLIYNEFRKEYEPPHKVEDIKIFAGVKDSLKELKKNGFELFLISNQPDFAKGKTSLENLIAVKKKFMEILNDDDAFIKNDFYCFHHPEGITEGYSYNCECRKPKTFLVDKAVGNYNIDRNASWFIGDRETDIECGINAGLKTVLIKNKYNNYTDLPKPDFISVDLKSAVKIILNK
ncbi:MAG TPA: HAD-IIIA family hydrolase [Ignavibacteria bacterium]|nr:HAD-IIIA family hydrolase [Ignavibacteria bacterium]HRA99074.1 HAD-IIIA family hydrolase [Ignavibacteria bacterium]